MMHRARWVKTPAEVALIEEAADLLDEAYLEVFATGPRRPVGAGGPRPHPGELHPPGRRMGPRHPQLQPQHRGLRRRGRHDVRAGRHHPQRLRRVSPRLPRPPVPNCDHGPAVGRAAPDLPRRPGRLPRHHRPVPPRRPRQRRLPLRRECLSGRRLSRAAWPWPGTAWGRGGHQQPPFLVPSDNTVLEAGMVLALEPHVDYWHLQDMALVTDDGPRLLLRPLPHRRHAGGGVILSNGGTSSGPGGMATEWESQ